MEKKVSIIVPVYNAEAYLDRSIGSVVNQTYSNWELLLVDDGSIDHSRDICNRYADGDERIRLICNQHGGTARARNTALDLATGEYIAFLDADDVYHPQYLSILTTAAARTGSQIALCKTTKGTDERAFLRTTVENNAEVLSHHEAFSRMYGGDWPDLITPYTKLYEKSLFSTLRFPDGKFFEDAAIIYRAIYQCDQIADTGAVLYFYNVTPNSSSKTKRACELLDRELALRSHWEFYQHENRNDLVQLAMPFYLQELITIYHKLLASDQPEKSELIRTRFEQIYRKYRKKITLTEKQNDRILAFRYPRIFDIRNMIREKGIKKTAAFHILRKIKKR